MLRKLKRHSTKEDKDMTGERRREIDKIMYDQALYGFGGERDDVPEDLYFIWYDIEEMTDINEINEAYNFIDEWFRTNNIK